MREITQQHVKPAKCIQYSNMKIKEREGEREREDGEQILLEKGNVNQKVH